MESDILAEYLRLQSPVWPEVDGRIQFVMGDRGGEVFEGEESAEPPVREVRQSEECSSGSRTIASFGLAFVSLVAFL